MDRPFHQAQRLAHVLFVRPVRFVGGVGRVGLPVALIRHRRVEPVIVVHREDAARLRQRAAVADQVPVRADGQHRQREFVGRERVPAPRARRARRHPHLDLVGARRGLRDIVDHRVAQRTPDVRRLAVARRTAAQEARRILADVDDADAESRHRQPRILQRDIRRHHDRSVREPRRLVVRQIRLLVLGQRPVGGNATRADAEFIH